jgi:hypothetical protein
MAAKKEENNPWPQRLSAWKKFSEQFHDRGRQIELRYEDEREAEASGRPSMLGDTGIKKVNMFYSNTTVIKESLYNSLPKPDVSRLHKGEYENDPARVAATIMERGLTYEIHCAPSFDTAVKYAILDRLVPGLGIVWMEFRPPSADKKVPEMIAVEIVYWKDFIYEPRRAWEQVMWAGRILHLNREEATEKWGEKVNLATPAKTHVGTVAADTVNEGKVAVIQMWDKKKKEVLHLTMDGKVLDRNKDPYQLKEFFPCPKPLVASPPTGKFLPTPDYYIAQDQYMELDILYARINLIIEAVRVAGCYDSATPAIGRMLDGAENKLIPVDNWALFAEKGGVNGAISWYPVETITQVLQHLVTAYEFMKNQLFEVTGMADIIRGSTNQYETAAAQQIKAQFASVRMNGFQRDVSFFVRDIVRIMGEIMAQMYTDEKLSKVCGQLPMADQEFVQPALMILRDDFVSSYSIDIETDSLTQADWGLQQKQRMEYISSLSQFLQSAVPAMETKPELAPLLVEIARFASVGFKGASELEGTLDATIAQLQKSLEASQGQPKPPSPEEVKAQASQAESQARIAEITQKAAIAKQQSDAELSFLQQKFTAELDFKTQMYALEMQHEQQLADIKSQAAQQKASIEADQNQARFVQERIQDAKESEQRLELNAAEAAAEPTEPPKEV